ncbi:MAG: hypothetical protein AAF487_15250 [Bacteroidota bacterium]
MKTPFLLLFFLTPASLVMAQSARSNDFFYEIPEPPTSYTSANVVVRMIDGLAFRFYWATKGLREKDWNYAPGPDARTVAETLDHVYGMSQFVLRTVEPEYENSKDEKTMSNEEKRMKLLEVYRMTRQALIDMPDEKFSQLKIKLGGGKELPFWNHINGPIEDAVWHCGQFVSFRRASGNPLNKSVSMFTGKIRD